MKILCKPFTGVVFVRTSQEIHSVVTTIYSDIYVTLRLAASVVPHHTYTVFIDLEKVETSILTDSVSKRNIKWFIRNKNNQKQHRAHMHDK